MEEERGNEEYEKNHEMQVGEQELLEKMEEPL
jgi:hypothetical protein